VHHQYTPRQESQNTKNPIDIPIERLITVAGDPIAAMAMKDMTHGERITFFRGAYASCYRAEIRRLVELGVAGPDDDGEAG
jgi:hypothetical protein